MRESVVASYQHQAEIEERRERHGNRIGGQYGPAFDPVANPTGFRAYVLVGKYAKRDDPPPVYWATAPDGRRFWMLGGMYRVWLAVDARLRAGRDLRGGDIATAAGVSRGYVSKVLHKLQLFGFITILGVWKGKWGRMVAKLRSNVSSLERTYSKGGNIRLRPREIGRLEKMAHRRQARYDDPYGSWNRALRRILIANGMAEAGSGTDRYPAMV